MRAKPNTSIAIFDLELSIYNLCSIYSPWKWPHYAWGFNYHLHCACWLPNLYVYLHFSDVPRTASPTTFSTATLTHAPPAQICFLSLRPESPSLSSPVVTKSYSLSPPWHLRPWLPPYWIIITLFLLISQDPFFPIPVYTLKCNLDHIIFRFYWIFFSGFQ